MASDVESTTEGDADMWTEETIDIQTPFSNMTEGDIDYLKLEVAELKQLLFSLAEKYKLSDDRRKVAEKRNTILKTDNERLQQELDKSLIQKEESDRENRKTLDKLREFIDFKADFEKQAELLKNIIGHLPIMKNASTTTQVLLFDKDVQSSCTVQDDNQQTEDIFNNTNQVNCAGDNNESKRIIEIDIQPEIKIESQSDAIAEIIDVNENKIKENENEENGEDSSNHSKLGNEKIAESKASSIKETKDTSNVKLVQLKQEVVALKNLNDWKSSDLEYKNRQLIIKNRELMSAKQEMTQLKMKINKLLIDQQKRNRSSATSLKQLWTQSQPIKDKKAKEPTRLRTTLKRKEIVEQKPIDDDNSVIISNQKVWKEIAPGDQVRIKMKKQIISDDEIQRPT